VATSSLYTSTPEFFTFLDVLLDHWTDVRVHGLEFRSRARMPLCDPDGYQPATRFRCRGVRSSSTRWRWRDGRIPQVSLRVWPSVGDRAWKDRATSKRNTSDVHRVPGCRPRTTAMVLHWAHGHSWRARRSRRSKSESRTTQVPCNHSAHASQFWCGYK
jgi:hypothetical protein